VLPVVRYCIGDITSVKGTPARQAILAIRAAAGAKYVCQYKASRGLAFRGITGCGIC
jgi:hypothetical protein